MKREFSIIRDAEYEALSTLHLDGLVLDVGGGGKAYYHDLIKGAPIFKSVNISKETNPDFLFDIEKPFPLENWQFDHSICLNVYEHIYEFDFAFSEQVRCVKPGGKIVVAVPFMYHIHGSPEDYVRFTETTLRRMGEKYQCEILEIQTLGNGLFSLLFQSVGPGIKPSFIRRLFKKLSIICDTFLNKLSKKYAKLSSTIPLGYFVVYKKR